MELSRKCYNPNLNVFEDQNIIDGKEMCPLAAKLLRGSVLPEDRVLMERQSASHCLTLLEHIDMKVHQKIICSLTLLIMKVKVWLYGAKEKVAY